MSPLVPAVLTISALATASFASRWEAVATATILLSLVALPLSRVLRHARQVLYWTIPIAIPLAIIHGVINPAFPVTHRLGLLPIRDSGFHYAATVTARVVLIAIAATAWRSVSRIQMLALAQTIRLPNFITLAVAGAIGGIALVETRVKAVAVAQQARGLALGPGLRQRIRALVMITVPVITTTLVEADHRGSVVAVRGLGHAPLARVASVQVASADVMRSILMAATTLAILTWP